ncbi:MAG: PAS domain-containing protein [Desulfobulbaceae bacterium]|nr:PAS domain-containing protein [Desulfobulbaceae bacterium]
MRKRRLLWQLYPSQLLITLVALLAVTLYVSDTLRDFYIAQTVKDLESRVQMAAEQIKTPFFNLQYDELNNLCREIGKKSSTRFTVILNSGEIAGDSDKDPAKMANHSDRPEVKAAFTGRTGSAIHFSQTLQKKMMYVAIPLKRFGKTEGVLRASISAALFDTALKSIYLKITAGSLIVAILTALVTWTVARRISRPMEEIKRGVERFAGGDFRHKLVITNPESVSLEVARLAETINHMSDQLNDRIQTVTRQHHQLEAVFAGMVESVFAVDSHEKVIRMNQAAADLLGTEQEYVHGRNILEVINNPDLREFVKRTLVSSDPLEEEFIFRTDNNTQRSLQAHGVLLRDERRQEIGALIVLNDVTRMRRLEEVRQDFVANVSHELKTPITSIKGYIETLLDQAVDNPDDTRRFLGIVMKQADRLNAIVEDLLMLSRLEKEDREYEISLTKSKIRDPLHAAIDACKAEAEANDIKINLKCSDTLTGEINPRLLEQAVINLVVNGVKYSRKGSEILINAEQKGNGIEIRVQDRGCGITAEHLPRLFERFYRSDKARSRQLGGTGLGLAIVKHIVQLHHGDVTVESTPEQGSTFTIHLPS